MGEYEIDLSGKILSRKEEIDIIHDGPSFEGKMEISHLSSQLKATENVIRDIVSEVYKQKRFKNPDEVKIYLQLKRGSFGEIISVVFNNPTVAHIIGGGIVALFIYFLEKRKQKPENISIYIKNLINNYNFARNLTQIIAPLENEKDEIHIISSDPKIKTNIKYKKSNQ